MTVRYGSSGGVGRRITDYEDEPAGEIVSKVSWTGTYPKEGRTLKGIRNSWKNRSSQDAKRPKGEVGKRREQEPSSSGTPSVGRHITSYVAPGLHGFAAGSHGHKLHAGIREYGEQALGALPGTAMMISGAKTGHIGLMNAGGLVGSAGGIAGSAHATRANNRAGRYKKQYNVGKAARYYDPEQRRQRRLGAYVAGGLGVGAAGIGLGGRGAYKATRMVRSLNKPVMETVRPAVKHQSEVLPVKGVRHKPATPGNPDPYVRGVRAKPEVQPRAAEMKMGTDKYKALRHQIAIHPKHLAMMSAGAAGIGGAAIANSKAERRRLGIWR